MISSIRQRVALNNGVEMPWFGLGVWRADDPAELDGAVKAAIRLGYESIDTADIYGNERGVGAAIKGAGVPRERLFVTTKLWNGRQVEGHDAVIRAYCDSCKRLATDYADLYLIHWPAPRYGKYVEAWKAMIELYGAKKVRAIGVRTHHLEALERETGFLPAVNQVELHPWLTQKPLIEYCRGRGIQVEAYSPLMSGHLAEEPGLAGMAGKYGKTAAQLTLRWHLQNGIICIPKSVHENRIRENAEIFDFEISAADMRAIDGLNRDKRFLPDPDEMNYAR
jgi:diketogulonate reductase-like aldo/keto reductase